MYYNIKRKGFQQDVEKSASKRYERKELQRFYGAGGKNEKIYENKKNGK